MVGAMMRLIPIVLCLAVVGCAAPEVELPPAPTPQSDTCGAAPYTRLIGQDATELERELILRQVRIIRPGDLVTQDFVPTRINFVVGPAGRIARIYCG